jgi:hypothetical protein
MRREKRLLPVRIIRRLMLLACCVALLLPAQVPGERVGENDWKLLAVAYPPDRDVSVVLAGAEKTLTAKGLCKVEWRGNAATLELEVQDLPTPSEIGWTGQQYILWAVDEEKRTLNLGLVPLRSKEAKWKVQVPFRVFGLLVTAENNQQATAPSTSVALESLLPTDSRLVVPVFRVSLKLAPAPG